MDNTMTTQDIVKKAVGDKKFKAIYKKLYSALQTKHYRLIREKDTLFFYKIIKKHTAFVTVINADDIQQSLLNFYQFLNAMKLAKFKEVHITLPNKKFSSIMQQHGYKIRYDKNSNYVVEL
jgi:hypothetical protein